MKPMVKIATLVGSLALFWAATALATTCQDLLANNSYDCGVVLEPGPPPPSPYCFTFAPAAPGVISRKFDLHVSGIGNNLGCTCAASGSTTSPKFNTSKAFDCMGDLGGAFYIGGIVGAKKISHGRWDFYYGESGIYSCTLRSTPCP